MVYRRLCPHHTMSSLHQTGWLQPLLCLLLSGERSSIQCDACCRATEGARSAGSASADPRSEIPAIRSKTWASAEGVPDFFLSDCRLSQQRRSYRDWESSCSWLEEQASELWGKSGQRRSSTAEGSLPFRPRREVCLLGQAAADKGSGSIILNHTKRVN